MLNVNKIITNFSNINFLYSAWTYSFAKFSSKFHELCILNFKINFSKLKEPFFGNWHYFNDLDINENRPHWGLKLILESNYDSEYEFLEATYNAFLQLVEFWQKGFTYITYLYKLYIHFNLSFSSIEFTFIDFYFSMFSSLDDLAFFLKENDWLVDLKNSSFTKSHFIDIIINHFISYPAFLNLLFVWSNQSFKYKEKWLNVSPEIKVKEVLFSELSILSIDTLYYLCKNLPWTLEQHKQDVDYRQEQLNKTFTPILENMLKVQKGEKADPNIPLLTTINFEDLLKK